MPFAVVLSCIDSRTSAELIFDQGLGDIFSVRIAGNFLNDDILGSMEFACHVAGAKLIVVLGHSHCGAIKGACDRVELGLLSGMLRKIQPSVDAVTEPVDAAERSSANVGFVDAVARDNVKRSAQGILERSDVLRTMHEAGTIEVVGGMYDVVSGSVDFFGEEENDDRRGRQEDGAKFPGNQTLLNGQGSDESEGQAMSRVEYRRDPEGSAGIKLSSNPRFLGDVEDALEKAPSWKPWTHSANARGLALVIVGLAGIGPMTELFRYGQIDFQSATVLGTAGLLSIAALCWMLSLQRFGTPEKPRAASASIDPRDSR